MALADLLALARAYGAAPEPGTPGTRNPQARGSGPDGAKPMEICGFPGAGTPGTPGTREIGNASG